MASSLALARQTPAEKKRININDIVTETIALAQTEIRRNDIALRTDLADDLPPVIGDRIQLQQVVLNLMMNGIEAIRAGKTSPRELTIRSAQNDAHSVHLAVEDSGVGLDPSALDQIFEGFYTTKPEGMGMGLTICRSIVEAHSGRIWATPAADKVAWL